MPSGTSSMTTDTARKGRSGTRSGSPAPLLLDSSAAIALVLEDHESHAAVLQAVAGRRLGLAGHAWFETYSVLTRLPSGQRRSPADVARILAVDFPASVFLEASTAAGLGPEIARLELAGGAVFDALVGAAARAHGLRLLSADRRARSTYEAMDVSVVWVAAS